jgi:peroxiredoxin
MAKQLNMGDLFPEYVVQTTDGRTLHLPQDLSGEYSVLVFYRGGWWPYCNRQLADYQSNIEEFKKENVEVVALSVDPLDKAKETVDKLKLTFPVVYGLQVPRDADKVGAFWEERRKIIHATNFILDADKKVVDASYSIGPIGRIVAADALSHVQFFKKRKAQSGWPDALAWQRKS